MKVYLLERSMLKKLKPLVADYQFKPYNEYKIEQSLLESYVIDEISDILSREENFVLVAEEMGKLVGLVSLERSDWDTEHFGIKMARIKHLVGCGEYPRSSEIKSALLSNLIQESLHKYFQHLTSVVHTEDKSSLHALESKGFRIMDTRIFYALDLQRDRLIEFENKCRIREFRQDDLNILTKIARKAFQSGRIATDRFHADPSLPKWKSDELYIEWIVNSCRGLADVVLVAEVEDTVVGYMTCKVFESTSRKLGKKFGSMVISAVSPSARQRGVYSSLFNSGLRWLAERVDVVEVGTQIGNYVVQRVWFKFGFNLKRSQHSLVHVGIT